ncbi:MAG TPA: transglutaminase-like domain-containing protein [Thermoanaerobaculia bacterium]|nr:transglutaminase-like domain-containing protein [Thermoanaerobaculia bacterium]
MSSESLYIHPAEARRRFEEFAAGEINEANLAPGALLVALEEYPRIEVDAYVRQLDEIAAKVRRRMTPGEPEVFALGHIHYELFDEAGFSGNERDYYDVRNSYLNEVIDRRVGIPITLSVVFIHVARRVGLKAHGVGLPGHFVVKVEFPLSEVYIDPFHAGQTLTLGEIDLMLGEMSGGEIRLQPHFLRRWSGRETLIRILANLQNGYSRVGEKKKALSAEERIAILSRYAPTMPPEPV